MEREEDPEGKMRDSIRYREQMPSEIIALHRTFCSPGMDGDRRAPWNQVNRLNNCCTYCVLS